jgi:hypothetical protein
LSGVKTQIAVGAARERTVALLRQAFRHVRNSRVTG